jgi:hypothetical protein
LGRKLDFIYSQRAFTGTERQTNKTKKKSSKTVYLFKRALPVAAARSEKNKKSVNFFWRP